MWIKVSHHMSIKSGRDKTRADKLIYIPNDDTQNYPFYKLQLVVVKTFGHSTNEPTNQN